jgi:hypothetical protein
MFSWERQRKESLFARSRLQRLQGRLILEMREMMEMMFGKEFLFLSSPGDRWRGRIPRPRLFAKSRLGRPSPPARSFLLPDITAAANR